MKSRSTPTRRARTIRALSIIGAIAISAGAVSQASYSAFSATTFTKGSDGNIVMLAVGSPQGVPLFTEKDIKPGSSGSKTITLTKKSSVDTDIALYSRNALMPNALSDAIQLTVSEMSQDDPSQPAAKQAGDIQWTGTLTDLIAKNQWSNGIKRSEGVEKGEGAALFVISWSVPADASKSIASKTAGLDLVWEIKKHAKA
ncbi:hypothetical protein BFL35_02155 [Clavibacter michiganensis]|nr:hypothetical protein BFL35_02155 [Clavibacter michiganensis]